MNYIISITNKCNLSCKYCYEKKLNTCLGNLNEETADRIIEFIKQRNDVESIGFFGGEPLLYKDIIKKIASSFSTDYGITTNGILLDEEFLKWAGMNRVAVNLSHDGKNCSDRGVDTELLNEKLDLLLKYQPYSPVMMVYTEKTLDDLYDNIVYFKERGVKSISAALDSAAAPDDIDAFSEKLKNQWLRISELKDIRVFELYEYLVSINNKRKSKCEICKSKMFINWDGKIYPCMQFQNNPEFVCGDVFSGLDYSSVAKRHSDYSSSASRCTDCEISKYCHNSCACMKMSTTGTLSDISDAACALEKALVTAALEKNKRFNF